ncbi:unnamed protein product, partial [Laminaria digitata]
MFRAVKGLPCSGMLGAKRRRCVHTLPVAIGLRAGGIETGAFSIEKETVNAGGGDGGDSGVGSAGTPRNLFRQNEADFSRKTRRCIHYISRHKFPPGRPL